MNNIEQWVRDALARRAAKVSEQLDRSGDSAAAPPWLASTHRNRPRSWVLPALTSCGVAAVAVAVVVTTSGGGGPSQAASSQSAAPSGSPSLSATGTPTVAQSRTSASSSPSGAQSCTPGEMNIGLGAHFETAGSFAQIVTFTNIAGAECVIEGYPGLIAHTSSGDIQGTKTPNGYLGGLSPGSSPSIVALSSGQEASAMIESAAVPESGQTCTIAQSISIGLPGATEMSLLTVQIPTCATLEVHPVFAGTQGGRA